MASSIEAITVSRAPEVVDLAGSRCLEKMPDRLHEIVGMKIVTNLFPLVARIV
jgi:hypothetical protein